MFNSITLNLWYGSEKILSFSTASLNIYQIFTSKGIEFQRA